MSLEQLMGDAKEQQQSQKDGGKSKGAHKTVWKYSQVWSLNNLKKNINKHRNGFELKDKINIHESILI